MENVRWIAVAALSAYACHLAVHHGTPIDHALPLLGAVVTFLAWLSYPAVMVAVPLLIVSEVAIADEPIRLLAFGAILAAAWGLASFSFVAADAPSGSEGEPERATSGARAALLTITALVLLRWIPLENVLVGREAVVLGLALATVFVLGRTPFAVAVAVGVALVTPAIPLRTLALPVTVLGVAAVARLFGLPAFRLAWPSTVAVGCAVLLFPWSGIVARALPYVLRQASPPPHRTLVREALAPGRAAAYELPPGASRIVVSGANVAHLRRGTLLGRIEIGAPDGRPPDCEKATSRCIPVRIGDAADWGYVRRDQWYRAHNPLPRDPAGTIRDYGYAAWVDGAGRLPLPQGARSVRVTADAALPPGASLQVEGFE